MTLSLSAQFAQAAYATLANGMAGPSFADALQSPSSGFTLTQAQRFAAEQTVVLQYDDDAAGAGGNNTSLSATVFKDTSGQLTLAIRGTLELVGDITPPITTSPCGAPATTRSPRCTAGGTRRSATCRA